MADCSCEAYPPKLHDIISSVIPFPLHCRLTLILSRSAVEKSPERRMASANLGFCSSAFLVTGNRLPPTHTNTHLLSFRRGRETTAPLVLCTVSKPAAETKPPRQPRGITKPKPISPMMQELLGVAEIPRTQALKLIWAYIKQHNLQDPQDKKTIVCDEKLKNIFGGRERVGFLEVSKLINPHFLK